MVLKSEEPVLDLKKIITSPFGDVLLLAHHGSNELVLLDSVSSWIWQACEAGLEDNEIARLLAQNFGVDSRQAKNDIDVLKRKVVESFSSKPAVGYNSVKANVASTQQQSSVSDIEILRVRMGQKTVGISSTVELLEEGLQTIIPQMLLAKGTEYNHHLRVEGSTDHWKILVNEQEMFTGQGRDQLLSQTIFELVELACDVPDRLMVVHGAGLVVRGKGVLLVGPGGSGKTTLAAAINAQGANLLSDDVVPVDKNGMLYGSGMSFCLKQGSWPILQTDFPELEHIPVLQRAGKTIKFLSPKGLQPHEPVPVSLFVFPKFRPDKSAGILPLSPAEVLQGIGAADSIVSAMDQQKLDALTNWVASAPAFRLQYPDLKTGMHLINQVMTENGIV